MGLTESLEFFLKGIDEGVAVCQLLVIGITLLFDVFLHDFAIFEYELKCLFELDVLLLLAVVLLLPLLGSPRVKISLLLQLGVVLDLLL